MTNLTAARIDAALAHPFITPWAKSTITSIVDSSRRYGSMTPKQESLVRKLVEEIEGKSARKEPVPVVDLTRINEMFDRASANLKRPFVMFLAGDTEFKVSPAPATGRNPGSLYVKARGAYAGKIAKDGTFSAVREAPEGILAALTSFAKDPAKAAHAYGQATGNCCFCARELTDARSVEVGYGPICADRYGLPWGTKALPTEGDAFYQHPDGETIADWQRGE